MPQLIGLFDVDENLIHFDPSQGYKLNLELCLAYKWLGVTEGMFFTKHNVAAINSFLVQQALLTGPDRSEPLGCRYVLREKLASAPYRIQITNTVTPLDIIYEKILSHQIEDFLVALRERNIQTELPAETIVQILQRPEPRLRQYRLGTYYDQMVQPWERRYVNAADKDAFIRSPEFQNAMLLDQLLADYLLQTDPDFFSNAQGANNCKYQLFRRLVASFGVGNEEHGVATIKAQEIIFIFSDDTAYYCEGVQRAANELGLTDHLIVINTGTPAGIKPAVNYLAQVKQQLKFINGSIERQRNLPQTITVDNQCDQAWSFNNLAFQRLAYKATNRNGFQGSKFANSTTFHGEIGTDSSSLLALKFSKLAWLTSVNSLTTPIHETLQKQICSSERLRAIYDIQLKLNSILDGHFSQLDFDDIYNGEESLMERFGGSPWCMFLVLSNNIDQAIIDGIDAEALFRLAMYYAAVDAATRNFNGKGNGQTINQCLRKAIDLERTNGNVLKATLLQNLCREIFTRAQLVTSSYFSRGITIYSTYARLESQPAQLAAPAALRPKPKLVGLFDVDGNLILSLSLPNNERHIINSQLIAFYKLLGITEAKLFTAYEVDAIGQTSEKIRGGDSTAILGIRCRLIEELQARGFIVQGVLTPQDVYYEKLLTGELSAESVLTQPLSAAAQAEGIVARTPTQQRQSEFKARLTLPEDNNPLIAIHQYSYYERVIMPVEQEFCRRLNSPNPQEVLENFFGNESSLYSTTNIASSSLKRYIDRLDGMFYNRDIERGVKNCKYHLFFRLVKDYGAGSLGVGIQHILYHNIVFVFSDDLECFRSGVWQAATECGLQNQLIIISTGQDQYSTAPMKRSIIDYFKQILTRLPLQEFNGYVTKIIHRQARLTSSVETRNQLVEAYKFNSCAFERLARKAQGDRKPRNPQKYWLRWHISTTFHDELGVNTSVLLALKFLKLAWLTCKNSTSVAQIGETLQEEIFHERLYKIYQAQLQLNSVSSDNPLNDPARLSVAFQNSPWEPFLDLSDHLIDTIILQLDDRGQSQSTDKVALFRLGLYYAVVDAASPNFFAQGNRHLIEQCFSRLLYLLRLNNEPIDTANAVAVERLSQEILTRQHVQTPGCFDRWFARRRVVLYACYDSALEDNPSDGADEHLALLSTSQRGLRYGAIDRDLNLFQSQRAVSRRDRDRDRDRDREKKRVSFSETPVFHEPLDPARCEGDHGDDQK